MKSMLPTMNLIIGMLRMYLIRNGHSLAANVLFGTGIVGKLELERFALMDGKNNGFSPEIIISLRRRRASPRL